MLPESTVVKRGNQYSVVHGTDDSLIVRFYWNAVEEKHFIKINVAGDSRSEWDRPVRDSDKQRFADKWEAYQAKQSQLGNQVLLEDAGIFNEARIRIYKSFNIETVNQLAGMSDGFISQVGMGTRDDVKKANVWLQEQASKHTEQELSRALTNADDRIQQLEAQLRDLTIKLSQDSINNAEPKRGRPPKEAINDQT